ncbi:hypothetical protein BAE44_0005415 [Dichanthelium oligosanthes]|uniref:DUF7788 domain-containing protein n=1 Tax=Dichanthelium oligosanthes TaxID=888268 RepID=A0A1E5W818_9POAL|nr:hypothetical protein BAE44_0005415 [Dichanthelium oligosanthes]
MSGTPIEVCVALSLLISELSEKPWTGRVIAFSQTPPDPQDRGQDPHLEDELHQAHAVEHEHQLPGSVRPHPLHSGGRPAAQGQDDHDYFCVDMEFD